MAKIERYNGNLAAFASQADTNRRTTFGTELTGDDTLDGNITPDYLTGWQIVGPNEFPTLEDFNAAFFTIGRLMAYVHQVGMPEWNGEQEYHINSLTNRNGAIYVCLTDNHVSATPPESDVTNWFNASQAGQNITVFDTAGVTNWPVPDVVKSGLRKLRVRLKGGGGEGGKGKNANSRGGGGGSGAYAEAFLDLTGVDSVPITVGAGAPGRSINSGDPGLDGGSTSFGAYITASAGEGGGKSGQGSSGGSPGTAVGGDINDAGTYGEDGAQDTSSPGATQGSGNGGGPGGGRSSTDSGLDAQGFGGGGGGARGGVANLTGGGKNGYAILEW